MSGARAAVLRYPGSKWSVADWIVRHLPPHRVYCEPFAGSLAVLFSKGRSELETVNDLDGDVVNLFRVVRNRPEELAAAIAMTPYARREHADSWETPRTGEPVEDARRLLVRLWQNHGMRCGRKGGWAHATGYKAVPSGGGITPRTPQWVRLPERILAATERLRGVQIECRPALDVMGRYAHDDCLLYCDPPYVMSTRGGAQYRHEMSDAEHIALLEALARHPGPVLLSGYASELYDGALPGWLVLTRPSVAEGGRARTETLWLNPTAVRRLGMFGALGVGE